jgi:hypothetical protein
MGEACSLQRRRWLSVLRRPAHGRWSLRPSACQVGQETEALALRHGSTVPAAGAWGESYHWIGSAVLASGPNQKIRSPGAASPASDQPSSISKFLRSVCLARQGPLRLVHLRCLTPPSRGPACGRPLTSNVRPTAGLKVQFTCSVFCQCQLPKASVSMLCAHGRGVLASASAWAVRPSAASARSVVTSAFRLPS